MGFAAEIQQMKESTVFELLSKIEPIDLLQFGMIPELIGRLPVIGPLDELSEEALLRILT